MASDPPSPPPATTESIILLHQSISTKLIRTNYLAWQAQIIPILHGYGLQKFLDVQSTSPSSELWHKQDLIILGWLRSSLSETLLAQTSSAKTTHALWQSLQGNFSAISRARLSDLRRQIHTISKGGSSCFEFLQKLQSIADELAFIGHPVSDVDTILHILHGLSSEYNSFIMMANTGTHSLTEIQALLLSHENLLATQSGMSSSLPSPSNPAAFYTRPNTRPSYQQSHNRPSS